MRSKLQVGVGEGVGQKMTGHHTDHSQRTFRLRIALDYSPPDPHPMRDRRGRS